MTAATLSPFFGAVCSWEGLPGAQERPRAVCRSPGTGQGQQPLGLTSQPVGRWTTMDGRVSPPLSRKGTSAHRQCAELVPEVPLDSRSPAGELRGREMRARGQPVVGAGRVEGPRWLIGPLHPLLLPPRASPQKPERTTFSKKYNNWEDRRNNGNTMMEDRNPRQRTATTARGGREPAGFRCGVSTRLGTCGSRPRAGRGRGSGRAGLKEGERGPGFSLSISKQLGVSPSAPQNIGGYFLEGVTEEGLFMVSGCRQKWGVGNVSPTGEPRRRAQRRQQSRSPALCPAQRSGPRRPGGPFQAEPGRVFSADSELFKKTGPKILTSSVPQLSDPGSSPHRNSNSGQAHRAG